MENQTSSQQQPSSSIREEDSPSFSIREPAVRPQKQKILVVDDEPRIVELLRRELGRTYRVFIATSGAEALRIMEKEPIVLVISDQKMPEMNGTELLKRIVKQSPDTVRILLTGYTDLEALVGAINGGQIYRYVSKPWETEELKAVVKQGIEHYELKEQNRLLLDDLKKNNLKLLTAYEELKVLDKAKDAFLSSVSHELRTPLTSIRSFSEILLNYEDTDSLDQKDFLGIIHAESERLMGLIDDVLDLSKIQSGTLVWDDADFALETLIQQVIETQKSLFEEKNLRVSYDCASDLPGLFADKDRIRQVITNLLNNAIKFSLEGGEVRIRAELFQGRRSGESTEWIRVSVSDQGPGIKETDRSQIFRKFNQGSCDPLTDKPEGTGLGLPLCKEIISHYGGNIWVESEVGKGSTFFFSIPANLPEGDCQPGVHSEKQSHPGKGR